MSGSDISWAICKSAPRSRQITMPTPHHSIFFAGRMPFLPPNQQHQITEGTGKNRKRGKIMRECAVPVGWLFCVYPMHPEQISHCNVKMWVCVSSIATPHTHPFNGPLSGTTRVSRYQKGKTNLDFTEARDSGISWAVCKLAPRSRQITMPAPHHSVFLQAGCPSCRPTNSNYFWMKSMCDSCSLWRTEVINNDSVAKLG